VAINTLHPSTPYTPQHPTPLNTRHPSTPYTSKHPTPLARPSPPPAPTQTPKNTNCQPFNAHCQPLRTKRANSPDKAGQGLGGKCSWKQWSIVVSATEPRRRRRPSLPRPPSCIPRAPPSSSSSSRPAVGASIPPCCQARADIRQEGSGDGRKRSCGRRM